MPSRAALLAVILIAAAAAPASAEQFIYRYKTSGENHGSGPVVTPGPETENPGGPTEPEKPVEPIDPEKVDPEGMFEFVGFTDNRAQVGDGFYSRSLVAGGPPTAFEVIQGSLPPGLSLQSDGVIAGVPQQTGWFGSIRVKARSEDGRESISPTLGIQVIDLDLRLAGQVPTTMTMGQNANATLWPSGGYGWYMMSKVSGTMPTGVTDEYWGSRITINGSPKENGVFEDVQFQVKDQAGRTVLTDPVDITVLAPPVVASGYGHDGKFGTGTRFATATPTEAWPGASDMFTGFEMNGNGGATCAIRKSDRSLWCAGELNGQLLGLTPVQLSEAGVRVDSFAKSSGTACIVLEGRNEARCFGSNSERSLGGAEGDTSAPWRRVALPSGGIKKIVKDNTTKACAIMDSGAVWCWGYSPYGELGQGLSECTYAHYCSAGGYYPFEVKLYSGEPYATAGEYPRDQMFGDGQAGYGVLQTNAVDVALGNDGMCVVRADGSVHCTGRSYVLGQGEGYGDMPFAQLGRSWSGVPFKVKGLPPVKSIAGVDYAFCAVSNSGEPWCWGWSRSGRLGNGDRSGTYYGLPVKARMPSGVKLSTLNGADGTFCGLGSDRRGWCWGSNSWNQVRQMWAEDAFWASYSVEWPEQINYPVPAYGNGYAWYVPLSGATMGGFVEGVNPPTAATGKPVSRAPFCSWSSGNTGNWGNAVSQNSTYIAGTCSDSSTMVFNLECSAGQMTAGRSGAEGLTCGSGETKRLATGVFYWKGGISGYRDLPTSCTLGEYKNYVDCTYDDGGAPQRFCTNGASSC